MLMKETECMDRVRAQSWQLVKCKTKEGFVEGVIKFSAALKVTYGFPSCKFLGRPSHIYVAASSLNKTF